MKKSLRLVLASIAALPSAAAFACASCGCSLSSDWDSQGLSSGPGFRFDLRDDYPNQNQVRNSTVGFDDYKPGNSLNVNAGFRYMGLGSVVPQLQINGRVSAKDSGDSASPDDSGGKTLYLNPGATIAITEKIKAYGFVQLPIYQNLNGYHLTPKYTASVGTRFEF